MNDEDNVADICEKLVDTHLRQKELHKQKYELIRKVSVGQSFGLQTEGAIKGKSQRPKGRAMADSKRYATIAETIEEYRERKVKETAGGARENERSGRQSCAWVTSEEGKTDRHGNFLKVGDKVEFLTDGLYKSKRWIIYKLTDTRVLCHRKNGQKTHREYRNGRKIKN